MNATGRVTFTTSEAVSALGVSEEAVTAAIRRLAKRGALASPARGFHVIVSPEYRVLGCLPAEMFVPDLMEHFGLPYYVGLLSAAEVYGAAEQKPQVYQVVTVRNRRSVRSGRIRIEFIARRDAVEVPTERHETLAGSIVVSTPEATAVDLVVYHTRAGGLSNVAKVLAARAHRLRADVLVGVAAAHSETACVQRLAYLLDSAGHTDVADALFPLVDRRAPRVVPLDSGRTTRGAPHDNRWRVARNRDIESPRHPRRSAPSGVLATN